MPASLSWQALVETDPSYITYQLNVILSESQTLNIGRLGKFEFPAGRYIYTGSARKNLVTRVRRHMTRNKTSRWHIDFLLMNPAAMVVDVMLFKTGECEVNKNTAGKITASGFGASDCCAQCDSHLKYIDMVSG